MEENNKSFDFFSWIKEHQTTDYQIVVENDQLIKLVTEFGEASITFTKVEEGTIVEFTIISQKDDTVKFYLHFELNDDSHAKQLYDEMVETLISLKDEKTLKVLLSCSAGLTTAMFADQLNSTAQMLGADCQFDAVSYLSIYEEVEKYDVILLAPQIGYLYNRLKESLPQKLVLQIPTAIFASYDALAAIRFVLDEVEKFNNEKNNEEEHYCCHCAKYEKRILSIVFMQNKAQTRIYYRLYDQGEIIDHNLIIKPSTNIYDLYDIVNTVILKYSYIDAVGIAIPGIIDDQMVLKYQSFDENPIDLKNDLEKKYHIEVYINNNTNAAAIGFSLEHSEYQNIIFHSQPFGYGIGGQGIIINREIITGKNGISGEIKFFLERMQLSDECHKLAWSEQGAIELVTKSLLPAICLLGPEAVAVRSPLTPDMNEIKNKLNSFVPKEFLPEFYYIKEASSYMLDGITKLCVDYLEKDNENSY